MSEILKAVCEAGLVTVLEGPLVMARQRCSLHVAGQPDYARFWFVLLSQRKRAQGDGWYSCMSSLRDADREVGSLIPPAVVCDWKAHS